MDQCTISNAQDAQTSSPTASQPNSAPALSESGCEAPPAAAATNPTDAVAAAAAATDAPASTNPTPSDPVTASASASPTHEFDPLLVAALARFVDSSLAMYEEGAPARAAVSLGTDVAAPSLALACAALDALLPSRATLADRKGVRPSRRTRALLRQFGIGWCAARCFSACLAACSLQAPPQPSALPVSPATRIDAKGEWVRDFLMLHVACCVMHVACCVMHAACC
jgi:hypothetical protein